MIHPDTFKKEAEFHGAKGLIFIGNKTVVMRRDNNTTSFPLMIDLAGGGREPGESPFDTFKREAKEEFGLTVEAEDVEYSKVYPSVIFPGKEGFFIVTRPKNMQESDIVFGDEGIEFLLMTPEEFVARTDGIERQQVRVRDYLNSKSTKA